MKKSFIITAAFLMLAGNVFSAHFILGNLYNSDGSMGDAFTANSFASVSLYRIGIRGQIGIQNNGPDEQYPNKIFPAMYNGVTTSAYCYTDVGSSDWKDMPAQGQEIMSVFETYKGVNGWSGNSYVGVTKTIITAEDIPESETVLNESELVMIPNPEIIDRSDSYIRLSWEGMDADYITGYTLYRKQLTSGNYAKITETAQNRGGDIIYTDDYGLAIGAKYKYCISVHIQWGGGSGVSEYYETNAKSAESIETELDVPTPSITPTPSVTSTPSTTPTPLISPQLAGNIEKEKLIIFNNPSRNEKIKLGYYSEGYGTAHIYLYNLTGETSYKKSVPVSEGTNIFEDIVSETASGIYVVRVTLDVNDRRITLPLRKLVLIK